MQAYAININNPVSLKSKQPFYCADSLLSLKAVRIPYQYRNNPIRLRITYKNSSGAKLIVPVTAEPPYFFTGITPNVADLPNAARILFEWVEVESLANFPFTVLLSLNTNLHSNLTTFHKLPE